MRSTYTYAILQVSAATYEEIRAKLLAAGYGAFVHAPGSDEELIDLHGLALQRAAETEACTEGQER